MSHTFTLPGWQSAIPVFVDEGLEDLTQDQLFEFPAFKNWLESLQGNLAKQSSSEHTFAKDPLRLTRVRVRDVTKFGTRIGFMLIEAFLMSERDKRSLERVVFLRGGSVAILMILRPKDNRNERYVILTEQPRIGACSTGFLEIPAGMLDDKTGDVRGQAIQGFEEETGLKVRKEELIDMTALALEAITTKDDLQPGVYPSPANLDEYIPLLLWDKELDRKEIEEYRGKLTVKHTQGELITVRVAEYDNLWREGARDAKTLAAWALHEGLNKAGKIEERLREIRKGRSGR